MNNKILAERRALIQSKGSDDKQARLEAVEAAIRAAVGGDCFQARLAARDLEEVGVVVMKGARRAAA